jgi:tetratricopeptide (TPR) repeat protein
VSRPRRARPARALGACAVLAAVALTLAGCRVLAHLRERGYGESRTDPLSEHERAEVRRARDALAANECAPARVCADALCASRPESIGLAILRQDIELACGADDAALAQSYLERAQAEPSATSLVLAARLAEDATQERELLQRALELDARSVWARYALAHAQAREGNWSEAQQELARALELDPAHLPSRRLEAALLARGGNPDDAIEALEVWLEASRFEPLVDPRSRLSAQLDLAHLWLLSGEADKARSLLVGLGDSSGDSARRLCLLAAAEQAGGRYQKALEASLAAENSADGARQGALPIVQQAVLHEQWLRDPAAARAAWQRVLSAARTGDDLGDLIQSMRARVVLERFELQPETASRP